MDLRAWLGRRQPPAPEDLLRRVEDAVTTALRGAAPEVHHGRAPSEERVEQLLRAAKQRLSAAASRPGRVRETAFELLVADALVTYACEAALETERPAETLERIVEVGRTR